MRLLPHLVEYMADTVITNLIRQKKIATADSSRLPALVENTIIADLEQEDRLDEEVRDLLNEHYQEVRKSGAAYNDLYRLVKSRLADKRGIVL